MEEKKLDRRARYTKMVLKQSLLELMNDRPIAKISVKELCQKADVNRTTFYAHYNDIEELLHQIEDELLQTIRKSVVEGLGAESVSAMMMDILSAIKDNGELCKILFGEYGDHEFLVYILQFAHDETISAWQKQQPNVSSVDLEKLYLFFCNGSIAIIRNWVLSGMKESPYAISQFVDRICSYGLASLAQ